MMKKQAVKYQQDQANNSSSAPARQKAGVQRTITQKRTMKITQAGNESFLSLQPV